MALLLWLLVRESLGLEPARNLESMASGDITREDVMKQPAAQLSKTTSTPPAATGFARAEKREEPPRAAEDRVHAVVAPHGVEFSALAETHVKRTTSPCEDDCASNHEPGSDALSQCKDACATKAETTPGTPENLADKVKFSAEGQVKCKECEQQEIKGEVSMECKQLMDNCKYLLDYGAKVGAEIEMAKLQKIEGAANKEMDDLQKEKDGSGAYGVGAGFVVAWALTL